jgi:hypothetical protein
MAAVDEQSTRQTAPHFRLVEWYFVNEPLVVTLALSIIGFMTQKFDESVEPITGQRAIAGQRAQGTGQRAGQRAEGTGHRAEGTGQGAEVRKH